MLSITARILLGIVLSSGISALSLTMVSTKASPDTSRWLYDVPPYEESYLDAPTYYPVVTGIVFDAQGTLWITMTEGPGFSDDTTWTSSARYWAKGVWQEPALPLNNTPAVLHYPALMPHHVRGIIAAEHNTIMHVDTSALDTIASIGKLSIDSPYSIRALAMTPSGDIITGGARLRRGVAQGDFVRRRTHRTWRQMGAPFNGSVTALTARAGGALCAGGTFTRVGDSTANHVAQWNGQAWEPMGMGLNGPVHALIRTRKESLYAGGQFKQSGTTRAMNIAHWNGESWQSVGKGLNGPVHALAVDHQGDLYAAGAFTATADGRIPLAHIARWDGKHWYPLRAGLSMSKEPVRIHSMTCAPNGDILVGGLFDKVDGRTWHNIARWKPHNPSQRNAGR